MKRTRLRKYNPKRRAKLRDKQFGPVTPCGRKGDWVANHTCCLCGRWPCDPAHYPSRGAGGTHLDITPLCLSKPGIGYEGCHGAFHRLGSETFQRERGVDLKALAAEWEQRWQEYVAVQSDGR